MASKKKPSKRKAARRSGERPERQQDPRLVAVPASGINGAPLPPGHWVLTVSPVRMDGDRRLMWHPPQPVCFNLIEAKRHRDRGVRQRQSIMAKLKSRPEAGAYGPENSRAVIDCISDLQTAVLFSFTAIESLANHAIEMLDDDATITRKSKTTAKADMTRGLGIDEKLKRVLPLVDGGGRIAGTETWTRYLELKFLRDELLHVKRMGYDPDPDVRTAYDRLVMGEGDRCVEDALATIDGAWPGFVPGHVHDALR